MITSKCPACGQIMSIHSESLALQTEIMCKECGSILSVDGIAPPVLTEVDLYDD